MSRFNFLKLILNPYKKSENINLTVIVYCETKKLDARTKQSMLTDKSNTFFRNKINSKVRKLVILLV